MTLRVAILGTGNIGTDLLLKSRMSSSLKVSHFIGRRADSPGVLMAEKMAISVHTGGFEGLLEILDQVDVVMDATSASAHLLHHEQLLGRNLILVNLTPAKIGAFYVPSVTEINDTGGFINLNMVTCGGQTSIPLIHKLAATLDGVLTVELASTLASPSAGPATRRNIDEYIENTSRAISDMTGVPSKALLTLNPAKPEVVMRSSIYVGLEAARKNAKRIREVIRETNRQVTEYCPGYHISEDFIVLDDATIKFTVEVESSSTHFPKYAGNLDIINTAAIQAVESYAAGRT